MKDLFKNYHRHKVLTNIGILSLSAILAVSVNSFLLSGQTGENLKANVLEATTPEVSVDLSTQVGKDSLSFFNTKDMQDVIEISFSFAYDPEIAEILENSSNLSGVNITEIKNNDGFITYILTFSESIDINAMSEIISVSTEKKIQETSHLNIINANFSDSKGEKYLLSSEGVMF